MSIRPIRRVGKRSAFRRINVHIVEMVKVRRVFQFTERREAMELAALVVRGSAAQSRRAQRAKTEAEYLPAGQSRRHARKIPQDRLPSLAALSASHHQMVGNADAPYSGSSAGRPKRSHRAVRTFDKSIAARRSYSTSSTRSSALVAATSSSRFLAKITRSINLSIAGFLMPIRLREPGMIGRLRAPESALLVARRQGSATIR